MFATAYLGNMKGPGVRLSQALVAICATLFASSARAPPCVACIFRGQIWAKVELARSSLTMDRRDWKYAISPVENHIEFRDVTVGEVM